ncbi:MAG: UDP-4-amino-4,6-dideoxy-N-acetyl-beta-L-altrosamine transaminase [Polyangiaceae bacterium]|nr:UDP-4-amino-4,6-dideoxy-N-acetyl-beta-L-altrosamine transaminase [Polyangiaceae bacterium]
MKDFLPYGRQSLDETDIERVVECLRGDWLTGGPYVGEFEEKIATTVAAPHALTVSNGTAALHLCLLALDLQPEDEVIVPAISFLASANCVRYVGAKVVFADVDPNTGLLDLKKLPECLSEKTRAVVPVHLNGAPVNLKQLKSLLPPATVVIEDAAHALGARFEEKPIGSCQYSQAAIFSFHPVKHITTAEGGAISTQDSELCQRLMKLRSHGMTRDESEFEEPSPGPWYYEMQELGFNYRLSDIQAALGLGQIQKLRQFIERRQALASLYDQRLQVHPWVRPITRVNPPSTSAWHLYPILLDYTAAPLSRKELMLELRKEGIGTQVHYLPIPDQPYYRKLGYSTQSLPGTQSYYAQALSLPLFPAMQDADVDRVCAALFRLLPQSR